MTTLEIIHLRMAGQDQEALALAIWKAVATADDAPDVRVYHHARVEGDLIIHLHREGTGQDTEASVLGLRLASLLRNHGMVGHSVWVRREEGNSAV